MKQQNKNNVQPARVKIIPLGGLEQIGMNITAIEYENDMIIIDCGLAFPSDDMLGIDLCIPDMRTIAALFPMYCRRSMCPCTARS